MSSYSNILDYRSKIQVFHSIIQDFQEKLGLSINNPGFSTYFWKSWIIKSKNLAKFFELLDIGRRKSWISIDNPSFSTYFENLGLSNQKTLIFTVIIQDFRIIGQWASKILDFQVIIQVFQVIFENLGLSNRNTWIFTLIIQDFRITGHWAYHRCRKS